NRVSEGLADFFVGHSYRLGNSLYQISTAHFVRQRFFQGIGGAQLDLDRFGSSFSNKKIILSFDVGDDRFVHLISRDANCARVNNATQADDRNVSGPTTD